MTVSQDILKSGPYNTDGTTKAFAATFQYLEDSDIVVTLLNTTTGATLVGVLNTDYTVVDNVSPIIGGTVTIANNAFGGIANASGIILAGYTITLNPAIPILQAESYPNAGLFPSAAVEQALDRLTLISQGLQLATTQSLKYPVTDSATISNVLPSSTLRANSFLAFDSLGNPIASAGTSNVSVNTAMLPVVQASTTQIGAELLLNGNIPSLSKAITDTNVWAQLTASVNSYAQEIYQNTSNGAAASTDVVLNNDQGSATTHYINLGINSSGFTGTGALNKPGAGYLYTTTGDLVIGTNSANAIHFVYNSGTTDVAFIDNTGFNVVTQSAGNNSTLAASTAFVQVLTAGRLLGVQVFNASGTYTPLGTKAIMFGIGGGGAGGGSGTSGVGPGGNGGATSVGTLLVLTGGGGGQGGTGTPNTGQGGAPGTATTATVKLPGTGGGSAGNVGSSAGSGAPGLFGAGGGRYLNGGVGDAAGANTGAGGAGGSGVGGTTTGGGGGGAGGQGITYATGLVGTYSVTIGAGGGNGTGGSFNGTNGGSGVVFIFDFA